MNLRIQLNLVLLIVSPFNGGMGDIPADWTIRSPEQAIAIANDVCREGLTAHPEPWQVRLKKHTWEVWRWNEKTGSLNVWVDAISGHTLGCVVEPK